MARAAASRRRLFALLPATIGAPLRAAFGWPLNAKAASQGLPVKVPAKHVMVSPSADMNGDNAVLKHARDALAVRRGSTGGKK